MSEEYDNRGRVALWKSKSNHPQAPAYTGTVIAHRDIKEGETVSIALWPNRTGNAKAPLIRGQISDREDQRSNGSDTGGGNASPPSQVGSPPSGFDDDSDIPFMYYE